jgi:hypothetical protein
VEEMKFKIDRTSVWGDKNPHVKGAYRDKCYITDTRNVADFVGWAYEKQFMKIGINHRKNPNGTISRELEHECWFININTIEELIEVVKRLDENIIIQLTEILEGDGEIEVYDYRE